MISPVFSSSISGLRAAGARLGEAASNIVNITSTSDRNADDANRLAVQTRRAEQTSLSAEVVELKQADIAYRANLQTIKAADDMMGELLDAVT